MVAKIYLSIICLVKYSEVYLHHQTNEKLYFMMQIFNQQINSSSDLTYGGAAIAVLAVIIIFTSVFMWAKKGNKQLQKSK
jgi:hypothetical protein